METTKTIPQLQRRIQQLQRQIAELGPLHPGTLTQQYNVCGTPGCQCKDPRHPRKHGPYGLLSFTWGGKSTSRFVRAPRAALIAAKLANYKRLRALVDEWIGLAVELEAREREQSR
jgi:hypothetical protein